MCSTSSPEPAQQTGNGPDGHAQTASLLAVFDIDGVLADVAHRLNHLERVPKDWSAFFNAADQDAVLMQGLEAVHEAVSRPSPVVYLSGRPEWLRRTTVAWLSRHSFPEGRVLLRPNSDRRPAAIFKSEALARLGGPSKILEVVDDDLLVVERLRGLGYSVRHATWAVSSRTETLTHAQEDLGRT